MKTDTHKVLVEGSYTGDKGGFFNLEIKTNESGVLNMAKVGIETNESRFNTSQSLILIYFFDDFIAVFLLGFVKSAF